jgi:hypothetical protein
LKKYLLILILLTGCNNADNIWLNGKIPYVMVGLTEEEKSSVLDCMIKWELSTNSSIKFRTVQENEEECLLITHSEIPDAAEAYLQIGNQHILYVSSNGGNRAILHGMGHVLGLMHEHQRIDRDQYITLEIFPGNPELVNLQLTINTLNAYKYEHYKYPYDYQSLMHYRQSDMADYGKIDGRGNALGNNDISLVDALKVIEMYKKDEDTML